MIHSVLKNASKEDVRLEPYPYIVVSNALDRDLYEALEKEYPFETRIDGYSGYDNNARYQISAADGLRGERLSPLWQEFVKYHTSKEFLDEMRNLFNEALNKYYPNLDLDKEIGVRFRDKSANFWMDCQPGINSPVKRETSVKGPHLDHPDELYGGLLYFRDLKDESTGGELIVYKKVGSNPRYYGARMIKEKFVKEIARVPYAPNTFVFFLNTEDSIHGVSSRSLTPYTRRLVNFIGEVEDGPLFEMTMRKNFTGILKKIRRRLKGLIGSKLLLY